MPVAALIALITNGAQAIQIAVDTYKEIKDTLSSEDQAAIEAALADAEQKTAVLRPEVDAALDAASKR